MRGGGLGRGIFVQVYGFELRGMVLLGSVPRQAVPVRVRAVWCGPCHPLLGSSEIVSRERVVLIRGAVAV